MQAAIGCLDLSLEQLDQGKDSNRYLQVTAEALERASRVVAQLRALHYPLEVEGKRAIDLNALLESVLLLPAAPALRFAPAHGVVARPHVRVGIYE